MGDRNPNFINPNFINPNFVLSREDYILFEKTLQQHKRTRLAEHKDGEQIEAA